MDFLGDPHDVRTIRLIEQLNKIRSQSLDPKWKKLRPDVDFGKAVQKELKKFQIWSGATPADGTYNPDTEQKMLQFIQNPSFNMDPEDAYIMEHIEEIGSKISGIASIIGEIGNGILSIEAPFLAAKQESIELAVKNEAIKASQINEMRFQSLKKELESILKKIDDINKPDTPFTQENILEGRKLNLKQESIIGKMHKVNPNARITIEKVWENFKSEDIKKIKVNGAESIKGEGLHFKGSKVSIEGGSFEVKPGTVESLPTSKLGRALKFAGNAAAVWAIGDIVWKTLLLCTSDSSNMEERANDLKNTSTDTLVAVAIPTATFMAISGVTAGTLSVLTKACLGTGIGVLYALVDFGFMYFTEEHRSLSSYVGGFLTKCIDSFSIQRLGESFEKNDGLHRHV